MDYYFFPAKFKHQSYDLIDIHDRMKFSEVFCTRSIINGSNFLKFHVLLCFLFCTAFLLFFFFNLLWKVFRARRYKSVSPTWNSQDSGCKWKFDPHLCNQCPGARFWVIGCSFQKAHHPPFTLRYLNYSTLCICEQSCRRNLYPKAPVLLYVTLGQLRFSLALQESSCVVILTPSTLLS